ncbi:arginine decarboxylase [Actinoplanes campanulatus]|uniref:Arginine decarboxylase n=1 Tax=Actinoplanes campanulatus TaxID=113559 RepID=A0A7W5FJ51_9ACTN|nr:arginine/lysine/ornithine decarboxylase [Actinoplanes campanulatus]MBB3100374.1 arginine decarboxylase [Actinoplanes campanulatus]GGN43605.1 ornithine decarboxylase [Actinoplanes campanulatus]GID40823.1 ornithine decarboxylase [Actinoplanes campanulatus]
MPFPVTIVTPADGPAGARRQLELLEAALIRTGLELRRLGDEGRYTERPGMLAHVARSSSAVLYALHLTVGLSQDGPEEPADVAAIRTAAEFVHVIRAHNDRVPILLLGEQLTARRIPQSVLSRIDGVVNAYEDTPDFLARKIQREVSHYLGQLAPPFFAALMRYANDGAYSWHCPGHSGGTGFLKSPIGTLFHDFFGENLLRADVCNAVEELGQLLDHTGPIADSERLAAKTFRADHLFFVTNGTSTSNKIVWNSLVGPGDIVAVDRNCHKSVLHAIVLTGAVPIYLMPTRNRAGVIGPIPRREFTAEALREKIEASPLIADKNRRIRLLALTQSTYDGIVYRADAIREILDGVVDAIHFDEAWLPHASFHDLYEGMHGVANDRTRTEQAVVYATQSTHKLLAGLSQASQILVQDSADGRFDERVFAQAYRMHTSTSPQYAIIASCDVSAEMMAGKRGPALVEETITEAMEFRRTVIRIGAESPDWWFGVWGPDTPPRTGLPERSEWELTADAAWHGFDRVDDGFAMLDPIKVTLTTPGLTVHGEFSPSGAPSIPGVVLARYLAEHGVVVEKTGLYSLFVLFTIGITKGRWNSLIAELHRFKSAYAGNAKIERLMPAFAAAFPGYAGSGLRDICEALHATYHDANLAELSTAIYTEPVEQVTLPTHAWTAMAAGRVEHVPVAELAGRTTAVLLTPYPPGIPLLVPGERISATIVRFLRHEQILARRWPGFTGITHGVAGDDHHRTVACLREEDTRP